MGQRVGRRKVELRPFDTRSLTVRTESGCWSEEDFEAFIYHHAGVCSGFHQISEKKCIFLDGSKLKDVHI